VEQQLAVAWVDYTQWDQSGTYGGAETVLKPLNQLETGNRLTEICDALSPFFLSSSEDSFAPFPDATAWFGFLWHQLLSLLQVRSFCTPKPKTSGITIQKRPEVHGCEKDVVALLMWSYHLERSIDDQHLPGVYHIMFTEIFDTLVFLAPLFDSPPFPLQLATQ